MAFDAGYIIGGLFIFYVVGIVYKKKTGNNISEMWKNKKEQVTDIAQTGYQRMYVNKGMKQ